MIPIETYISRDYCTRAFEFYQEQIKLPANIALDLKLCELLYNLMTND